MQFLLGIAAAWAGVYFLSIWTQKRFFPETISPAADVPLPLWKEWLLRVAQGAIATGCFWAFLATDGAELLGANGEAYSTAFEAVVSLAIAASMTPALLMLPPWRERKRRHLLHN